MKIEQIFKKFEENVIGLFHEKDLMIVGTKYKNDILNRLKKI